MPLYVANQLELCNESGGMRSLVSAFPLLAGGAGLLFLAIRLMTTTIKTIIRMIFPRGDLFCGWELIPLMFVSLIMSRIKGYCRYQKMNYSGSIGMNFLRWLIPSIGWMDEKPSFDLAPGSCCHRVYSRLRHLPAIESS